MKCLGGVLFLLAVLASCNAAACYIPVDKEVIYKYHGTMTAGTHLPKPHRSSFVLDGKLHVQNDNNSTLLKFTDLKFKMDNGVYNEYEELDTKMLDFPKELASLMTPFRVIQGSSGTVKGISTESGEPQYVVNIKKAIAAMFQLDIEQIPIDVKKPITFRSNENSVYGTGKVNYMVKPDGYSTKIQKLQRPHSTHHMYTHTLSNIEYDRCSAQFDETMSRDSETIYIVGKVGDDAVLKSVDSTSGTYYTPYEGLSDAFAIRVHHQMLFESLKPIETKLSFSDERYHEGLTYYVGDLHDVIGPLPDITNGRHHWDKEKLLKVAQEMITEIGKYLEEDHVNAEVPNIERGQMINRFTRILNYFHLEEFEKLHEILLQNTKFGKWYAEIYYEILPHIGTHAASYHIKKLVEGNKLKGEDASEMVQRMFSNVKFPNKKLVDDMSHILSWGDDIPKDVRNAAILGFSNLLRKAHYRHVNYNKAGDYISELNLNDDYPDHKYYTKYVNELAKRLKDTKDSGTKILYIQALCNTRMPAILEILIPIVKGETSDNNNVRMIASLAISPMVLPGEDIMYELFWPMMTDDDLSTGLRIIAYYLLMRSEPSISQLINIEWEMQSTTNVELYQFHYRYISAMAATTDPCKQKFKLHLKQVLRYVQPPEYRGLTGYYQIDYTDEKYGFGEMFNGYIIHDKQENEIILRVAYQQHTQRVSNTPQLMFIRIGGLPQSFLKDIKLDFSSTTTLFNRDELAKILKHLPEFKDLEIDVVLGEHNQIIMTYHYDNTNLDELHDMLALVQAKSLDVSEKVISIDQPMSINILVPTEMGFPALLQYHIPEVHYIKFNFIKEVVDKITTYQLDTSFKHWSHWRHGLTFYNPVADVWQGVNRFHSNDGETNFLLDMQIDWEQQSVKVTWKRHEDPGKSTFIGTKSHSTTMVFVKDDDESGILHQSSSNSNEFEFVSWGNEYRHDYVTYEVEDSIAGYHGFSKIFDSERYINKLRDNLDLNDLAKLTKQNHYTKVGKGFLALAHHLELGDLEPETTVHGEVLKYNLMTNVSVSHLEFAIHFNSEYKKDTDFMLPAAKHDVRLTFSSRSKEVDIVVWDVHAVIDNNFGHTHNKIKMDVARIAFMQPEAKFCFDVEEKWEDDRTTLDLTMSTNFIGEGLCTKSDSILNISAVAERLSEQDDEKHIYDSCRKFVRGGIRQQQMLKCYQDHSSLRKFTYTFTSELREQMSKYVNNMFDTLKSTYKSHLIQSHKPENFTGDLQIVIKFPVNGDIWDLSIATADKHFLYLGIPSEDMMYDTNPNTQFSHLFNFMHGAGITNVCLVNPYEVSNIHGHKIGVAMSKEWTMYFEATITTNSTSYYYNSKHGLWVKSLDGEYITMKVVHDDHSLQILPSENGYDFLIDGTKLEGNTHHHTSPYGGFDWIKESNVVSVFTQHFGSHVLFDGHNLQLEYPQSDIQYFGHCFDEAKE